MYEHARVLELGDQADRNPNNYLAKAYDPTSKVNPSVPGDVSDAKIVPCRLQEHQNCMKHGCFPQSPYPVGIDDNAIL